MFTGFFRGVASIGAPTVFEKVLSLFYLKRQIIGSIKLYLQR